MIRPLDELKNQQSQILLAELAGLLHNIGKLDPNFLAQVVGAKNSLKLNHANDQLTGQSLTIPQYAYKRFSSPSFSILSTDVEKILNDFSKRKSPSFPDFCQALKNCSINPTEIQALIDDWSEAQKTYPFIARATSALWQFFSFSSVNNGPLYFLLPEDRKKLAELDKKLSHLTDELGLLGAQVRLAPIEQKRLIGKELNERKKERDQVQEELNAIFDFIQNRQKDYEVEFRSAKVEITICSESWAMANLLTLFWDKYFFYKPNEDQRDYKRQFALLPWLRDEVKASLPALLILAHGEVSGIEKGGDDDDSEPESDKEDHSPAWEFLSQSTAFGLDNPITTVDVWPRHRKQLLDLALSACDNIVGQRDDLIEAVKKILGSGVGDTQWPINEITLWDYASSIATLFKSAVAKAVLEDRLSTVAEVKWRLLSIRYDGLEYLSRAHHISDLLARSAALEAALNAVKSVIEVEYPMGNEIYRDENGSVLLVPDVRDGDQRIELLAQECGEASTLESLLLNRFSQTAYEDKRQPLDGEVRPLIALSDEFLGKQIKLTEAKGWQNPPLQPDPDQMRKWWPEYWQKSEVCTVCNLRPQGYVPPDDVEKKEWVDLHFIKENHRPKQKAEPTQKEAACQICKAQSRQICWVCMKRRDDRSKKWATDKDGSLKRTIWTDEVADNNGRLALVVGRFVLDGWLDGTLIPTMQKSASFARIQRCWRTTLEFWQEVENELPDLSGKDQGRRLKITSDDPASANLGPHHVYDLEFNGRHLSVVWTGKEFITADNLDYFSQTASLGKNPDWKKLLEGKLVSIFEPSAHLSRRERKWQIRIKESVEHEERYSPFIPIMAQPSLFMALVPADKALEVTRKIRCKYEKEMGKVRDRLPIHLGVVFAPRRTPVRALLEAGRKMLEMPDIWELWRVKDASVWDKNNPAHIERSITFETDNAGTNPTWSINLRMGDQKTPDEWYPHFLRQLTDLKSKQNLIITSLKHARDFDKGDEIYVRPSRFDFEFLDTAGRRFEISYDEEGRRRGLSSRPLLLEDLKKLDDLWDCLVKKEKKLSTSHLQHLESTLTSYITEWFDGDITRAAKSETYRTFAIDVLRRLDSNWWKSTGEEGKSLENAVTSGLIFDLLELRMHILKEKSDTD